MSESDEEPVEILSIEHAEELFGKGSQLIEGDLGFPGLRRLWAEQERYLNSMMILCLEPTSSVSEEPTSSEKTR